MKIGKFVAGLTAAIMILAPVAAMPKTVLADGDVAITQDVFKDSSILEYVKRYDKDNNGYLSSSEIYNVRDMQITFPATTLEGLEVFTSMTRFELLNSGFTSLDLSVLPSVNTLTIVDTTTEVFTSLDISKSPELLSLTLYTPKMETLNISNNQKLKELTVYNTPLSKIDISNNPNLELLAFNNTSISSLDLSRAPNLKNLFLADTGIVDIDLSHSGNLQYLNVSGNPLIGLDISNNPRLSILDIRHTNLRKVNISNNPYLLKTYTQGTRDYTWYGNDVKHLKYTDKDGTKCELLSPSDFDGFQTSTPVGEQGISGFVERLYTIALNRPSDPNGKLTWIDLANKGYTGADIAQGFLFSPEFLNRNMTNEEFVTTLYRTFFKREPDLGGLNYWVFLLEHDTAKTEVIMGFINSSEWTNVCIEYGVPSGGDGVPTNTKEPSRSTKDFVSRLYSTCLNRAADTAGLNDWSFRLANYQYGGASAAKGFFFSNEFINANYSNEEFVTKLYKCFFNREPDLSGYYMWTRMLNTGSTREEIFYNFSGSREWLQLCLKYGIPV